MCRGLFAAFLLALSLTIRAAQPDVVLVSLDTFRADRLAAWGGDEALCTNLNALAGRGTAFTRCVTPVPVTLPAHATLLTGCFPARTGLHDNGIGSLARDVPTLAEALKTSGYGTRAVLASSVLDDRYGLSRGFAHYDDGVGRDMRRTAEEVTDRALDAYRGRTGPLFLWVHYFDTHEPYATPENFRAPGNAGRYDTAAAYLDSELGRLLRGLGPQTLVAVVSDHGEGLGEHGEGTHGTLLYQTTLSAVFLLAGPAIPAGLASELPCSLADVTPTLARLAGVSLKGSPDGADLTPGLAGRPLPVRAFPLETWMPYTQFRWSPLVGVTDGRWKWVRGRALHLFDLKGDPKETRDLAAKPPAEAQSLRAKLPKFPEKMPASVQVDSSLRGLGYAPVPSSGGTTKNLPDPHERVGVLQKLDEGRSARTRGEESRAVALFREVCRQDPGNPSAWFELGETLRRKGEAAEAAKALDRAMAIAPSMPETLTARGLLALSQEKEEQAAALFEKALKSDPTMVIALNPLAAWHLSKNRPAQAIPLLERASAEGFANADTYLLLMRVHLVQAKREAAEKDFREAMALSTDPPATLKSAADIFIIREMVSQGVALYEEGIRRYPTYVPNYLTLGSYFLQVDQPERALELYRKALTLDLPPADRQNVTELVAELEGGLVAE